MLLLITEISENQTVCELCERVNVKLTKHHLIPSALHSNKWFKRNFTREELYALLWVCRPCHSAIHRFVPDNKLLARGFNTKEKLLENEKIRNYAKWQSKR